MKILKTLSRILFGKQPHVTPQKVKETQTMNTKVMNNTQNTENTQSSTPSQTEQKNTQEMKNTTSQTEDKKNTTGERKSEIHNIIIVDESGSMLGLEKATLGGIKETINSIRSAQELYGETQQHYLTLVTFDSPGLHNKPIRLMIDDMPIDHVKDFTEYSPCGCTPLYDAVGSTLKYIYEKIKDNSNATGVVTIITDGMENSSREWNTNGLSQFIEQLTEMGWTFSYMGSTHDVKTVTQVLHIENVIEFSHDDIGTRNSWARESSAKMEMYRQMSQDSYMQMSDSERRENRKYMSRNYYGKRVTPDFVTRLEPNQVFVFGSSPDGSHAGGAARQAVENFGAIVGQGEGMQGQSYAIPITDLQEAIDRFVEYARMNPDKQFLVTEIGCGHGGFTPMQVAPMFAECIKLENVSLPEIFWNVLGLNMSI